MREKPTVVGANPASMVLGWLFVEDSLFVCLYRSSIEFEIYFRRRTPVVPANGELYREYWDHGGAARLR